MGGNLRNRLQFFPIFFHYLSFVVFYFIYRNFLPTFFVWKCSLLGQFWRKFQIFKTMHKMRCRQDFPKKNIHPCRLSINTSHSVFLFLMSRLSTSPPTPCLQADSMTPRDSNAHCQHRWMTLWSVNEHIKIRRITGLIFQLEVNYKLPIAATRLTRCSEVHATDKFWDKVTKTVSSSFHNIFTSLNPTVKFCASLALDPEIF